MEATAFHVSVVPTSVRFPSPLKSVSLRPLPRVQNARVPPRPPPGFPRRDDYRPRSAAAWLSGHDDCSVLAAASLGSSVPHRLTGCVSQVIASAQSLAASSIYLHRFAATTTNLLLMRNAGLTPIQVNSSTGSSVEPQLRFLATNTAPSALVPLATAAVASPLLLEKKDNTVSRFVNPDGDVSANLVREEERDDRPILDRIVEWLTRVYLPQGFPTTTTPDYISFTKYRTLQNLASAIMQVISTEALLFGLGLGKKVAAGAAATSWVLKDGASYIVKIGYGSIFGSKFDDDPKSWRIAADIVEDVGGAIEILTPLFPLRYFLPLASLAVCLRGMSLMTGTATRHVVYRSLAANGMQNTGDIATKGESQGVTMKMIGLGTGIVLSSTIGQRYFVLLGAYSLLAGVHIAANWKSVQCVQFSFLNKQRASILIENHLNGKKIPSPYDASKAERIILPPWKGFEPSVKLGVSVKDINLSSASLREAISTFKGERFLIIQHSKGKKLNVLVRENATNRDLLRAYYTVKKYLKQAGHSNEELKDALRHMKKNIRTFERAATQAGWDTSHMNVTDGQFRVSW